MYEACIKDNDCKCGSYCFGSYRIKWAFVCADEVLIIGVYVTVNLIVYVNDHMVAESMNQKLEEMRKRKDA